MNKEFYSVREAAEVLGLSRDRIYEYLRNRRLYGTRLTEHSAWRIPIAEIERMKGTSLGKSDIQLDTKPNIWAEYLGLAVQLQNSLSRIGPKDWAIWGFSDSGSPPDTSEAGLRLWIERGELVIKLSVEMEKLFPLFMSRMKSSFSEFNSYGLWRESLADFVSMCLTVAAEIRSVARYETNLLLDTQPSAVTLSVNLWGTGETPGLFNTSPAIREGYLINVSKFVYEFAIDDYGSGKQPVFEILERQSGNCWIVPWGLPDYVLAMGFRDEMEKCRDATVSLAMRYAEDERVGEIIANAQQLRDQATPLQSALSAVIEKATGDG